jgi:hypothetical protein
MSRLITCYFECIVAKRIWSLISEAVGFKIGSSFESLANSWLCNKRFGVVNIVSSAVYWSLWKLRNDLCFLGEHEDALVQDHSDAAMLEATRSTENGDWLRSVVTSWRS